MPIFRPPAIIASIRVHQLFLDKANRAHGPEDALDELPVSRAAGGIGGDGRRAFLDHHRNVGHRPEDGNPLADDLLDQYDRHRCGQRDQDLVAAQRFADLLEHARQGGRLHREDDDVGGLGRLAVPARGDGDAEPLRQLPGAAGGAHGRGQVLAVGDAALEDPADERGPNVAGADDGDLLGVGHGDIVTVLRSCGRPAIRLGGGRRGRHDGLSAPRAGFSPRASAACEPARQPPGRSSRRARQPLIW